MEEFWMDEVYELGEKSTQLFNKMKNLMGV